MLRKQRHSPLLGLLQRPAAVGCANPQAGHAQQRHDGDNLLGAPERPRGDQRPRQPRRQRQRRHGFADGMRQPECVSSQKGCGADQMGQVTNSLSPIQAVQCTGQS